MRDNAPRALIVLCCFTAALLAGCGGDTATSPGEWPRFRGADGNGLLADAASPVRWSAEAPNIRWKTPISGDGNSQPIVSGGRVFLTTTYGQPTDDLKTTLTRRELQRAVLALDLETGEILWQTSLYFGPKGVVHWFNTQAAPTSATDGTSLFVSFDSRLAALDFDGNVLWQKDLDPGYVEQSEYGASTSVVLTERAAILMRDREGGGVDYPGWIVALDKETGEEIWRYEWMHTCCSYTTPLLVSRGGSLELLHSSSGEILALDAETGEVLWQAEHPVVQPVPSLLVEDEYLVSAGAVHSKAITVYRLSGSGAETAVEPLWQRNQYVAEIASPIFYRGKLFTVTEGGIMVSYRPHSGKILWRERLPPGTYRASPVAAGGRIYLPTEEGSTAVVSAKGTSFQLLAENKLPDGGTASPALTSHCLLLRTKTHLYCIGNDGGGDEGSGDTPGDEKTPEA